MDSNVPPQQQQEQTNVLPEIPESNQTRETSQDLDSKASGVGNNQFILSPPSLDDLDNPILDEILGPAEYSFDRRTQYNSHVENAKKNESHVIDQIIEKQNFPYSRYIFSPFNKDAKRKAVPITKPILTTEQLFGELFHLDTLKKTFILSGNQTKVDMLVCQRIETATNSPQQLEKLFEEHKAQNILKPTVAADFELYKKLIFDCFPEMKLLYQTQELHDKAIGQKLCYNVSLDYESQTGAHTYYRDGMLNELELSQNEFFDKPPPVEVGFEMEERCYQDPPLLKGGAIFAYGGESQDYCSENVYIDEVFKLIKRDFDIFSFSTAKHDFDSWMDGKLSWLKSSRVQLEQRYRSLKPKERNLLQEFLNGCHELLTYMVAACAKANPSDLSENTKSTIKDCFDHIYDKFDYNTFIINDVIEKMEGNIEDVEREFIYEKTKKEEHIVIQLQKLKELSQSLKEKTLYECFGKVILMKRSAMFLIKMLLKHNLQIRDEEIALAKQHKQPDTVIKLLEKHKVGGQEPTVEQPPQSTPPQQQNNENEFFKNVGTTILSKLNDLKNIVSGEQNMKKEDVEFFKNVGKNVVQKLQSQTNNLSPEEQQIQDTILNMTTTAVQMLEEKKQETPQSQDKIKFDIKMGQGRLVCEFQNLDVQMLEQQDGILIKITK